MIECEIESIAIAIWNYRNHPVSAVYESRTVQFHFSVHRDDGNPSFGVREDSGYIFIRAVTVQYTFAYHEFRFAGSKYRVNQMKRINPEIQYRSSSYFFLPINIRFTQYRQGQLFNLDR